MNVTTKGDNLLYIDIAMSTYLCVYSILHVFQAPVADNLSLSLSLSIYIYIYIYIYRR